MVDSEMATLLPLVRWAQRKETVSLKVELQECQKPDISLKPGAMIFQATGVGAKGKHLYRFSLDFFKDVDVESVVRKLTGSSIEIFLTKDGFGEWWPRLTTQVKSPHFLKLDFDKWKSESDDEVDETQQFREKLLKDLQEGRKRYEETADKFQRAYLIIYNMTQFLTHLYISCFCVINIIRGGTKIFPFTYDRCGNALHLAVALSFMEAVHPLTSIMKSAWTIPLMQTEGRNFALLCLWLASDFIKKEWYVTVLFVAWSSIELFRYPLYICQIVNLHSQALTWIRYTIWIPLYPLGTFMEAILYIRASQAFNEQGMYELQMPNTFNFAIKFTWIVRLYVAMLFYSIAKIMIPHMWKMRQKNWKGEKNTSYLDYEIAIFTPEHMEKLLGNHIFHLQNVSREVHQFILLFWYNVPVT